MLLALAWCLFAAVQRMLSSRGLAVAALLPQLAHMLLWQCLSTHSPLPAATAAPSLPQVATAVLLAVVFSRYNTATLPSGAATGILVCICCFIAAYSW